MSAGAEELGVAVEQGGAAGSEAPSTLPQGASEELGGAAEGLRIGEAAKASKVGRAVLVMAGATELVSTTAAREGVELKTSYVAELEELGRS